MPNPLLPPSDYLLPPGYFDQHNQIIEAMNCLIEGDTAKELWAYETLIEGLKDVSESGKGSYWIGTFLIRLPQLESMPRAAVHRLVDVITWVRDRGYEMMPAEILTLLPKDVVFSVLDDPEAIPTIISHRARAALRFVRARLGVQEAIDEIYELARKCAEDDRYDVGLSDGLIVLTHYKPELVLPVFDRIRRSVRIAKLLPPQLLDLREFFLKQPREAAVWNTLNKFCIYRPGNPILPRQYFPLEFKDYAGWDRVREYQESVLTRWERELDDKAKEEWRVKLSQHWSMYPTSKSLRELMLDWIDNPRAYCLPIRLN